MLRLEMKRLSAEMNATLDKLALFGYSAFWLEAGLITPAFLDRQVKEFNDGLDEHSEHYRYAAFIRWVDGKESFTHDEISAFMILIREDSDPDMAESAAFRLLNHPRLTDNQFERLSGFIAEYADGPRSKLMARAVLLRRLKKSDTVSPEEFAECDGSAQPKPGAFIGQQERKTFGLVYRTKIGNDLTQEAGYKLHLVWGAVAAPSEKAYATINDSPEPTTFSWEITTTPVNVTGYLPTSTMTLDSIELGSVKMAAIEAKLFGDATNAAALLMPDAILALITT